MVITQYYVKNLVLLAWGPRPMPILMTFIFGTGDVFHITATPKRVSIYYLAQPLMIQSGRILSILE